MKTVPPAPPNMPASRDRIADETDLIQTYLAPLTRGDPGAFGLRDDAALLTPEPGTDLVFTSDPIVASVHFFPTDSPADIAWKALAVNASDLAAKGARPIAYMLNLAFPERPSRDWMSAFAEGLRIAQESFGCHLIGGDTDMTPGPLTVGVTIIGAAPRGKFVRRQGAASGDHVFVTGTLGDSALGLAIHNDPSAFADLSADEREFLVRRYLRPEPRLGLTETLRAHASAALDVSDGLLKDLARLAGPLGLVLDFGRIPLSRAASAALMRDAAVVQAVLGGGGDYELLVAVHPAKAASFSRGADAAGIEVCDLGMLREALPLQVLDDHGTPIEVRQFGYDHFSR